MPDAARGKCSCHVAPRRQRGDQPRPGGASLKVVGGAEGSASVASWSEAIPIELLDRLAAALRELRPFIPDNVWWDAGAAQAVIEYDGRRPR